MRSAGSGFPWDDDPKGRSVGLDPIEVRGAATYPSRCTSKEKAHELENHLAILLIALGVVAFAYQGITYSTRSEGVDLGPIHMSTQKSQRIPLPPIVGGSALVGGIVLLIADRKRFTFVSIRFINSI